MISGNKESCALMCQPASYPNFECTAATQGMTHYIRQPEAITKEVVGVHDGRLLCWTDVPETHV